MPHPRPADITLTDASGLQLLVEHTPLSIAMFDRDMRYVAASRKWLSDYGRAGEPSPIGRSHYAVFPNIPAHWRAAHQTAMAGGSMQARNERFEHPAGMHQWVSWEARPWRDASGEIAGIVIFSQDVSERMQVELAMNASEAQSMGLLRHSSSAIATLDALGTLCQWNAAFETFFGRDADALHNVAMRALLHPDDRPVFDDALARTATSMSGSTEVESRACRPLGQTVWVRQIVAPLTSDAPRGAHFLMVVTDMTAARLAERQLKDRDARIAAVMGAVGDCILVIDRDGTIQDANPATARHFGHAPENLIGATLPSLLPSLACGDKAAGGAAAHAAACWIALGVPRELAAVRGDGSSFPARFTIAEMHPLELYVCTLQDLSETKALQRQVLESVVKEQRRIGRELHDSTLQELAGLGLLAQTLTDKLLERGVAADAALAGRISTGIDAANRSIRALARGLVPVPVDAHALHEALRQLARLTEEAHGIQCRFRCERNVDLASAETATHLFRIAQEAVRNAIRHAHASTISVELREDGGKVALIIRDDGVGIASGVRGSGGVGLHLMEHRSALIDGQLVIRPGVGGGTEVSCTISAPVPQ